MVGISRAAGGGVVPSVSISLDESAMEAVPATLAAPPQATQAPSVSVALGTVKDEQGRRMWNVLARKLPYEQRDVARSVMPDPDAARERVFQAIGQAAVTDDDDAQHPIGSTAAYSLKLTDPEAKAFKAASNAIDVSPAVPMSRPPLTWGR